MKKLLAVLLLLPVLVFGAQTTSRTGGQTSPMLQAQNLAVSVAGTGNTEILNLPTLGLTRIMVHLDVTVHNLDAFVIKGRARGSSTFNTLYSTSGHYTTPTGILVATSTDLTALAVGAGWFIMDVGGIDVVQVLVSGTADGTLVSAFASGY